MRNDLILRELVAEQVREWPKTVAPKALLELLDGFARKVAAAAHTGQGEITRYEILADHAEAMSDEQVLADVRASGQTSEQVAREGRDIIQAAVQKHRSAQGETAPQQGEPKWPASADTQSKNTRLNQEVAMAATSTTSPANAPAGNQTTTRLTNRAQGETAPVPAPTDIE